MSVKGNRVASMETKLSALERLHGGESLKKNCFLNIRCEWLRQLLSSIGAGTRTVLLTAPSPVPPHSAWHMAGARYIFIDWMSCSWIGYGERCIIDGAYMRECEEQNCDQRKDLGTTLNGLMHKCTLKYLYTIRKCFSCVCFYYSLLGNYFLPTSSVCKA